MDDIAYLTRPQISTVLQDLLPSTVCNSEMAGQPLRNSPCPNQALGSVPNATKTDVRRQKKSFMGCSTLLFKTSDT
ncbi:predicted protein [Botrytis cinerea T4]|uniref:Uncharacterized protein n=1 Tax=Botryotinia fuckeliana (strain T4) TaxID=999810 RepID=G2XWD5_BOTF4|nr:predicted protein [Botrytis cinerea T4]